MPKTPRKRASHATAAPCPARPDRYSARPPLLTRAFSMATARYDVLGIGNAIVDVIARAEEDFLLRHGMRKGTMALIDEPRAQAIYDAMGPAVEMSGGSAANTIVGLASLGARAAYVGKVKDDQIGGLYTHDSHACR